MYRRLLTAAAAVAASAWLFGLQNRPVFGQEDSVGQCHRLQEVLMVAAPQQGAAFYDPEAGAVVYVPNPDFAGADGFQFAVARQNGAFSYNEVGIDAAADAVGVVSHTFGGDPGVCSAMFLKKKDGGSNAAGSSSGSNTAGSGSAEENAPPDAQASGDDSNVAEQEDQTPRFVVIVYVDQPGEGGDRDTYEFDNGEVVVGHAFIAVVDNQTGETTTVGFYPDGRVSVVRPETDGVIHDDAKHPWDVMKEYPLTEAQYNELLRLIETAREKPPEYDLNENNCADWVIGVLAEIGIKVPDTQGSWPLGGGTNPGDLGEDLVEQGGERNGGPDASGDAGGCSSKGSK
jgi:hypothetical protein